MEPVEPVEPGRNDENCGFSGRRISSILKAPRKSIRYPDPEQEIVVECPKPVEKRNSRRVSFAPANDVLLFSNEVKNACPARSPFQDLRTSTTASQNRVQITEDEIQQITGMETLLNAPLHAPQKAFGEQTVMFSKEDALMDMTHCQTINIANAAELLTDTSFQSCDVFPPKETNTLFCADNGARGVTPKNTEISFVFGSKLLPLSRGTDPTSDIRSISSTVPSLDPDFENFLAGLFKSNDAPSKHAEVTVATPSEETRKTEVDKENQAPQSVRAVVEGSLNASRRSNRALHGRAMTETFPDDGGCSSFPTKEFFLPLNHLKQQSSRTAAPIPTEDKIKLKTPHQRDTDGTIMFSAADEFMDMTQSHTVNIANGALEQSQTQHIFSSQKEQQQDAGGLPGASVIGSDQGFKDFLMGLSKTSDLQGHKQVRLDAEDDCRDRTVRFSAEDADMDVTQSHTVNIATDNMNAEIGGLKTVEMNLRQQDKIFLGLPNYKGTKPANTHIVMGTSVTPSKANMEGTKVNVDGGDQTGTLTAEETLMDVTQSHTVNILSGLGCNSQQNLDFLPVLGEKTVRFSANEAAMDVTQSHTVNIICDSNFPSRQRERRVSPETVPLPGCDVAMEVTRSHTVNIDTGLNLQPARNSDFIPVFGEKTVRFTEDDAAMEVTRSHTVNIDTGLNLQPARNSDFIPVFGEKTVRFTEDDAAMDVTRSHTVNINTGLEVRGVPSSGEKTLRFTDCKAAMDVTKSLTVNIASDVNLYSEQRAASGEETLRFAADDAAMDETESHTVNISTGLKLKSHPLLDFEPAVGERTVRFSAKEADMDVTRCHTVSAARFVENLPTALDAAADVGQCQAENSDMASGVDSDLPHRGSASLSSEEITGCPSSLKKREEETSPAPALSQDAVDTGGDLQTGKQFEENPVHAAVLDGPAVAEAQTDPDPSPDEAAQSVFASSCEGIQKVDFDAHLTAAQEECEPRNPVSTRCEDDVEAAPSRKSRRMSFADLHTKIRRLSHMISVAPDSVSPESSTAALPQHEQDVDRNRGPGPEVGPECGPVLGENQGAKQGQNEEATTTAAETPFKLKTQQLMSRLSMIGFRPKLPQRSTSGEMGAAAAGEQTKTLALTGQLRNFDADVSDINDEELDSCEDVSEGLDTKSPCRGRVKGSPPQGLHTDGPLEDSVFEGDVISAARGNEGCFPSDEGAMEDERRMEAEAGLNTEPRTDCDSNVTSAPATDESSSRAEATFESTFKQSLFESQLEDYACDMQRKFSDGTITVLEFFKLFNIDFVIHNPRQSILPERRLSDAEQTPLDSLKDRHIHHPKHKVYEADVLNLTQQVEGLKERMHDLQKPLRVVNHTLGEEMRSYTEEELKSFGAKLKERSNFFRKMSKAQSHQMKEALYSELVRVSQAEQQRLEATVQQADHMITTLDGCITQLQAELDQVVEQGSGDSLSLKSLQHEMNKVTEALTDGDRQTSELEAQMLQNSQKLKRLRSETEELENQVSALHSVCEWRSPETSSSCSVSVYTFLYDTFHLELTYEGGVGEHELDRNISHIVFQHHIEEEKAQDYARMVHKLLSHYTQGQTDWVQKYPTGRHVPQLLRDVSLVVGRLRLLGEELRLLKMWGGLRLDVLSISCVDTLVHVIFSSLKKMAKFEVVFSVSLRDHHYVLHLHSFKNLIGDTTLQQVDDVLAPLTPGRNLLTKAVKNLFENLLR